jgi:hypothetical protein
MPRTLALLLCASLATACEKSEPRAVPTDQVLDREETARRNREAMAQIVALEQSTNDLIAELEAAIDAAQSEAERSAAKARLAVIRKQQAELQAKIEHARAAAARAERLGGRSAP